MCEKTGQEKLQPWLSHNPSCDSAKRGPSAPCTCGYEDAANLLSRASRKRRIANTMFIGLLFLSGCIQRSQTGEEQIAAARKCEARGMNVVGAEGGFPWGGLEYAECVKPPRGVTPAEFINGR